MALSVLELKAESDAKIDDERHDRVPIIVDPDVRVMYSCFPKTRQFSTKLINVLF